MPDPAMVSLRSRFVRYVAVGAGWAVAAFATGSVCAWIAGLLLSDRWGWSQWFAWIPTLAALVAACGGFVAAWRPARSVGVRRRRVLCWAGLVGVIAGYFFTVENRPLRTAPEAPVEALRIVHWNVSSPSRDERWATPERVLELDAHVVILTDAFVAPWRPAARERFGDAVHLARSNPFGVISHLPILEARALVAVDEIFAYLLRIDASETAVGREVSILAIDLPSDLTLSRMEVAKRLRRLLIEVEAPPEEIADLFIGDFNITRGSASLRELLPGVRHAWHEAGRGWSGTYPREVPLAHIDHVFVTPGDMRIIDYEVIDLGVVRHRAQRVTVIREER